MSEQIQPPTSVALTVPPELAAMTTNVSQLEVEANGFVVDSEGTFQVADEIQADLKSQAKTINDKRLEFTRPLDKVKKAWMDFFSPAVDARTKAAGIYQNKMSAFRRAEREKAEAAQREAEELLRKEREKLEAEARKREADALKLKTESARAKALADAADARTTAAMMPTSVAPVAFTPRATASSVAETPKGRAVNTSEALRWLADHPEWQTVVEFKPAELNRMSKQFGDVKVPGFEFYKEDSFRNKARRAS